jgi:hypothetical protein
LTTPASRLCRHRAERIVNETWWVRHFTKAYQSKNATILGRFPRLKQGF